MQNVVYPTRLADMAAIYLQHGIQPIPLPFKSKKPILPDWPNLRITVPEISEYFNDKLLNIGGILGAASGGIVSIDTDWPEAVKLAPHLLPKSWSFGRNGQVRQLLIRAAGAKTERFDCPVSIVADRQKRRIVELLSDGTQAMLPGSTHPEGEVVKWINKLGTAALAEMPAAELLSRVSAIAGAALLMRIWPDLDGTRHDVALALTGALHHAKWPHKRIETLLTALLVSVGV